MQTRRQLWHQWERQLQALLPHVRVTRIRPLALLSLGILWAGSVTLLQVAASLPLATRDLSRERRLRRWLANRQVSVGHLWPPVLQALLANRAGQELLCVFDPTPIGPSISLLLLGLVVHQRILPLAWHPLPSQRKWPACQATVLRHLTQPLARVLPVGAVITLVADCGLTGPGLIDRCGALGWHFVLRLNADARQSPLVRLADGTTCPAWALVTHPGQRWTGTVDLYQAAGWRTVHLTIHWASGAAKPWLLLSDRPAGPDRVREYRRRVHCEATFEDTKRRGFDVERTKITQRARLSRLLLALFLALWWAELLGLRVIRRGLRAQFDRHDRRDLSLVRVGRRWLVELLAHDRLPPLLFRFVHVQRQLAWTL